MDWLDTETKALLQKLPPEKLAPPDTTAFTLVLLAVRGQDRRGLLKAVQRAAQVSMDDAQRIVSRQFPATIRAGLSYTDAQIAQFELVCGDAASAFIADEVVAEAPVDYLTDLYAKLLRSDEFELVPVRIDTIPDTPTGEEFCDRFLSGRKPSVPAVAELMRKKARIMEHWAKKIGGRVAVLPERTVQ
ncbi:MAG: hypothetical protein ACLQLG_11245 [Thermoguttaceae bacterium]